MSTIEKRHKRRPQPKGRDNPVHGGTLPMHLSPRCGAYARTHGGPCRNAAMANGRCRMHGGKNPGAPKRNTNSLIHGEYSVRTAMLRKRANALMVEAILARSDVERKVRWGLLQREEAEKQRQVIKAKIAEAHAMRLEAITWPGRALSRRED